MSVFNNDDYNNRGPLHDRCPKCHKFAIMVDHYDEYICIECYRRELPNIATNKDRKENDTTNIYSLATEPLKNLIRRQSIEIWD